MSKFVKTAAAAVIGTAALALTASSASAAIACNKEGVCWHVKNAYNYKPEYGVVVHENNWKWGPNDHYVWREHTGRGYFRNGVWIRF